MTTTTETRALPILFAGPMVRAIWADLKTNTRRVINCACNSMHLERRLGEWGLSRPPYQWDGDRSVLWRYSGRTPSVGDWIEEYQTDVDDHATAFVRCPYGKPGDRLWVRETWCGHWSAHLRSSNKHERTLADGTMVKQSNGDYAVATEESPVYLYYRATYGDAPPFEHLKWTPSIHMPRWASRLTLDVTDVRVERLQDISEEDALAEGFMRLPATGRVVLSRGGQYFGNSWPTARDAFRELWDSINNTRGYSWESNPWVWAVSFKRQQEQTQ